MDENVIKAKAVINFYFEVKERIIGAVAVYNLVIVDMPDAFLIANKNHSQEVQNINYKLTRAYPQFDEETRLFCENWGNYAVLQDIKSLKVSKFAKEISFRAPRDTKRW